MDDTDCLCWLLADHRSAAAAPAEVVDVVVAPPIHPFIMSCIHSTMLSRTKGTDPTDLLRLILGAMEGILFGINSL